jgi:hypothetical protein
VRTGGREIGGGRDCRGIGRRLGSTEMHGVRRPLRSLRAARPPPTTPRQHQAQGIRLRGSSNRGLEHANRLVESTL